MNFFYVRSHTDENFCVQPSIWLGITSSGSQLPRSEPAHAQKVYLFEVPGHTLPLREISQSNVPPVSAASRERSRSPRGRQVPGTAGEARDHLIRAKQSLTQVVKLCKIRCPIVLIESQPTVQE